MKKMKPTMSRIPAKNESGLRAQIDTPFEVPTKVRKGKIKPVSKKKVKVMPTKGVTAS